MIDIRELQPGEFVSVADLDVTEEGAFVYTLRDQQLSESPEAWRRPPLDAERCRAITADWPTILDAGGVVLGATDGNRLVGVATLVPRLTTTWAQLHYLHVSRPYRRQGVARQLVTEVIRRARESGAEALYVSATPSQSAVGFYRSMGFVPVAEPHPRLFALEPEDIHMSLPLR